MPAIPGGNLLDHSGSVTTGGTDQQVASGNISRQYLMVQNIDPAEDLWVNIGTAAGVNAAGSIQLKPAGAVIWESGMGVVPTGTVHVVASTTGHKFTCKEA